MKQPNAKDLIKKIQENWFAKPEDTTIMNWKGIIKDNEGIFDYICGTQRSKNETEERLKRDLFDFISGMITDYFKNL